ncbi:transposase [Geminisphaera colitermitum]|uniref:transposase n=1 Tax=Geminisphaera colitermitum TaxID=1148786 RepID=UPI003CE4CF9D
MKWVKNHTGWKFEIVKRTPKHVFTVLPKRWIVERTFDWMMFWWIMNRHHERKYNIAENIMRIIMIKLMLRKLFA